MVSSISRNYLSGISSGMDTESLISQMIEAASTTKYNLERKRNKMSYQQSMLQEINLKLYELQTKATDLTFSKTFNGKTVESTDSKIVNASATTAAKAGTYTVKVKQLATATNVTSKAKLAGSLELGNNITSSGKMGGSNTSLGALGVNPTGLKITTTASNGQVKTYNIATNADENTSIDDMLKNINNSIKANSELSGKITATYDDKNNTIKFNLNDSKLSATISDGGAQGADGLIAKMFGQGAGGEISLSKDIPVKESSVSMRSGAATTLKDLDFTKGSITISMGGRSQTINMNGLDDNMTVDDLVKHLNSQIDRSNALNRTGTATGNPKDRAVEFRYDESSGNLRLVSTNTGDTRSFTISDANGGTFVKEIFGKNTNTTVNSNYDGGQTLANETFATPITAGVFTIDGTQINIDPAVDTLQGVLSRISAMTNIDATYDSETDRISFTRRDGSTAPIGVGSSNDTSNFLSVTGMIAGTQTSAAHLTGSSTEALQNNNGNPLSVADFRNKTIPYGGYWGNQTQTGTINVNVNGTDHSISWQSGDTYQSIIDKIADIEGIESAYYDASTGKINVVGKDKGSSASISISDRSGNMARDLGINSSANGSDAGSTLTASKSLSDVKTSSPLAQAGFATAVTSGTFSINGVKFTINNTQTQTMDSIIDAINNNDKVGVKAQYNPTTGEFILTSTETGNRAIAIGSATDTSNFLSAMGLTGAVQNIGQNCIYSIDSVYGGTDQVSQSNTITDAIEGLTLNFRETTVGAGETISINTDTESAKTAIKEFIDLYNEVTETIFNKITEKKTKEQRELTGLTDAEKQALSKEDLETYEEAYKVGLLSGDTTLRNIRSQMRNVMSAIVPEADALFNSLSDIGITTGKIGSAYSATMVGTLSITDEDKLDQALRNNPEAVTKLFNNDSTNQNQMGIARRLKEVLNSFTKSNGLLTSRIGRSDGSGNSQMDKQINALNEQISQQQIKLSAREENLLKKFAAMETALNNYQAQSQSLSNSLSQLMGK